MFGELGLLLLSEPVQTTCGSLKMKGCIDKSEVTVRCNVCCRTDDIA